MITFDDHHRLHEDAMRMQPVKIITCYHLMDLKKKELLCITQVKTISVKLLGCQLLLSHLSFSVINGFWMNSS